MRHRCASRATGTLGVEPRHNGFRDRRVKPLRHVPPRLALIDSNDALRCQKPRPNPWTKCQKALPLGFEPRPSALTVRRNASFARADQPAEPEGVEPSSRRRQRRRRPLAYGSECARWESDPRCFSLATRCHATRRRTRNAPCVTRTRMFGLEDRCLAPSAKDALE